MSNDTVYSEAIDAIFNAKDKNEIIDIVCKLEDDKNNLLDEIERRLRALVDVAQSEERRTRLQGQVNSAFTFMSIMKDLEGIIRDMRIR